MRKEKTTFVRLLPFLPLCFCGLSSQVLATEKMLLENATTGVHSSLSIELAKRQVQGVVLDGNTREPLMGATVIVKGSTVGTTTNMDGQFTLNCAKGDILTIEYLGYSAKEIKVTDLKLYTIELNEDAQALGEVVVTAFGAGQKKASMVGSVSQIKPDELKIPSSSLSNSFAGRLSGVIAVQRSGEPGADGSSFWIRGKSTFSGATGALIIIDGVEAVAGELNRLDPEVIESFSILKDATATALYGTRGANGVMIVTTKNGRDLDKPIINIRVEGAVNQLTKVPEMTDGATYMRLYNEAVSRPGSGGIPYSDEKIDATARGVNPLLYPDVNWYNELFKKNSFSQRANFNIRGGNSRVDYFMSVGVKHSDGNMKSISKDYFSYNNNINITNYDFVNNLNVNVTKTTKLGLGLNLSVIDKKGPGGGDNPVSDLFKSALNHSPVDFPVMYPAGSGNLETSDILWGDKSGGAYPTGYQNPVAEFVTKYRDYQSTSITANFKIEQNLKMVLPGLKFSGLFSFKNWSYTQVDRKSYYNAFEIDSMDAETGKYTLRRTANESDTSIKTEGKHGGDRRLYLQAMLDYKQVFNDVHDLNVMFLFNRQEYKDGAPKDLFTSLPQRKQGIAGRVSYAYDGRYLAEANFGYNGSENFAKGNRYGFFPSFAIGWNISEEKFWESLRPHINNLKLRASWGLVGNDNTGAGRFAYMQELKLNDSPEYKTGIDTKESYKGPKWSRYFTPNLGWEVGEKWNVGVNIGLFDSFTIDFDVFKEVRSDIFMNRDNTIPQVLGTTGAKVYANLGKVKNSGLDFSIDYNKQVNKNLFISFKSTFTYAHNIILERDEPPFRLYPNLSSVGHSLNQNLLYIANGLFPDQATIKNNPTQTIGLSPVPGDIWYVNQPNAYGEYDGIIDSNDRVYVGNPTDPEIVYGFGPSLKWKKWDFSFFFQGVAKTSLLMSGVDPFGNIYPKGLFKFVADDHWTDGTNEDVNAKHPRFSYLPNGNNTAGSTYWLRNGAFLKLKNAEIGYTLKNCRFYVSGNNLLTFSPFKHWDPEMGGGNGMKYPTQRSFNVGIQVTFNNK